jgi:hypothetical protein
LLQAQAPGQGLSVRKAAPRIGAHRSTSFRWRRRFLALPREVEERALSGAAGTDETFVLRPFNGQREAVAYAGRQRGVAPTAVPTCSLRQPLAACVSDGGRGSGSCEVRPGLARPAVVWRMWLEPQAGQDLLDDRPLQYGRDGLELAGAAVRAAVESISKTRSSGQSWPIN